MNRLKASTIADAAAMTNSDEILQRLSSSRELHSKANWHTRSFISCLGWITPKL